MQEFIDENETADEDLYEHHRFEIAKGQQAMRIDVFFDE
jgi:23S rRNA pseudouridine1911/1915/1917 synthase